MGTARFLDAHTIEIVDSNNTVIRSPIRARFFVLCTGAGPIIDPAFNGVPFKTYETIFDNDVLPARLAVIGAGPIGCELGQAYSRLGAVVTMVARKLLPKEEPAVQEASAASLSLSLCLYMVVRKLLLSLSIDLLIYLPSFFSLLPILYPRLCARAGPGMCLPVPSAGAFACACASVRA